ncbi:MAG: PIN domain-containing protein [Actinomycetota bacterium]|nr:PIN domain-containing protein [Actinomycetota bacterium]
MTRGLLDTSVFIAREQARPLAALPDEVAVSVVSIGELELGVLAAGDLELRARRGETLALARAADPIPVTEAVMGAFARLVHDCRRAGARPRVLDALIAATGVEHGLPVVTQDDDFAAMAAAHAPLAVVRV